MPHAALWVVQPRLQQYPRVFQAWFQCRTRLCGWCSQKDSQRNSGMLISFNAARGYSLSPPPPLRGPPPPLTQGRLFVYGTSASLPDAQDAGCCKVPSQRADRGAHAARGFVGGAAPASAISTSFSGVVSMPHAALWVVQPEGFPEEFRDVDKFQCRTRLFPFAPTTASRSPSPARAGEALLRAVFSQNHAILASPAGAGEVASAASR